ncbi:hypothetical protein NQZ68_003538 [Dissostichus eleginoides]|nr:hypothetical protein NQZ68_003538 [Dissostichus eleginoides]
MSWRCQTGYLFGARSSGRPAVSLRAEQMAAVLLIEPTSGAGVHKATVFKTLEKTHEEEKPQVNRSSEEHLMEAAADAEKQSSSESCKLVRKASSVVGVQLDNLEEVAEGRTRRKLDWLHHYMYVHQLLGWSRNLSCWDVYLFLEVIPLRTGRMKPVLRIEFNVWCLCLGTGNHCTVVEQIKKSEAEEESVLQHPSPVFGKQPWNHVAFIVGKSPERDDDLHTLHHASLKALTSTARHPPRGNSAISPI